jgi:cysteine-rich repeat protein
MKKSAHCLLGFLVCVVGQPVLAVERIPAEARKAHAAELFQQFGQAFEASRQVALSLAQQGFSLVESPQGGAVCGNSILDGGEQCDDGNSAPGDGCSEECQVETGYNCTDPVPVNLSNLLVDPGFEGGPFGGFWDESSTQFLTPICDVNDCELAGQRSGDYWAWFGGADAAVEEASVSQQLVIPASATELRFWLALPSCHSAVDFLEVLVDGNQAWVVLGDDPSCGDATYVEQVVDVSTWADGQSHEVAFHGMTNTPFGEFTDFFLDDVYLAQGPLQPIPSVCGFQELIFLDGFETFP